MSKEAMKLALEALEKLNNTKSYWWQEVDEDVAVQLLNAETALQAALAEQPAQQEPVATLKDEVIGCFNAAFVEGLQEALAETQDERLKDLVERRLMYALYAAQETSPQPAQRPQNCGTGYCSCIECLFEQPAPVAWPCVIAEADFSEDTVTLAMQCTDYKISSGKHWLCTSPPAQQEPFIYYRHYDGGTQDYPDEKTIPLYTSPPQRKESK